jgi:hypothetical protein
VSEQQAEQTTGETGSVATGAESTVPGSSDSLIEAVMASVREAQATDAPALAPAHEAPKIDLAKVEMPKMETPKVEAPKAAAPMTDAARQTGKLLIMSRRDRPAPEEPEPASATHPSHRFAAMAAVVALAIVAGAIGGALATAGLNRMMEAASATTPGSTALEAAVARIDADIVALKAGLENTSRLGTSHFNKTNDRLDKIEKAQAEPGARLARLSEAIEKLRATPPAVAAVAAAPAAPKETTRDTTGSITAPAGAAALPLPAASSAPAVASVAPAPPKQEAAHSPTVEGWVLRDVGNGGALIEGRTGLYEVYAGDPVPGLGRIDAIRKLDGRWVVVTSKGLIVAR